MKMDKGFYCYPRGKIECTRKPIQKKETIFNKIKNGFMQSLESCKPAEKWGYDLNNFCHPVKEKHNSHDNH